MSIPTLTAKARTITGRKTRQIREEGTIPAIVYGAGVKPQNIQVDRIEFVKLYNDAGESTIVELQVDGKSVNVLMYDYQLDPLRDEVIHADFRAIDMKKKIDTNVKIQFIGESPAVKALGGTLITPVDELPIRALPGDLPKSIKVDLAALETFDDAIRVENLSIPQGVEVLRDGRSTIAVVAAPRTEEEMAALDEAIEVDVEGVEVEGEKAEGEEGAEGEAPAEGEEKKEPASAEASSGKEAGGSKKEK